MQPQTLPTLDLEATAADVLDIATRFLVRWTDPMTLNLADDIAQLTALDALRRQRTLHDRRCLPGFVRTIARRMRFKTLQREHGRVDRDKNPCPDLLPERHGERVRLRVRARWIARDQLLPWLADALDGLPALNSRLLREFYGGSSCRDLAVRHRLSMDTVKVRLHRSRERVRANIERRAVLNLT